MRRVLLIIAIYLAFGQSNAIAHGDNKGKTEALVAAIPVPALSPGTLVKNEPMTIMMSVMIDDPKIGKPKLQIYDSMQKSKDRWRDVASLKEDKENSSEDSRHYGHEFWMADTGLITSLDKKIPKEEKEEKENKKPKKPKKPKKAKFNVASPVHLRLYAKSKKKDVSYVSETFSLDFLDIDLPVDPGPDGDLTILGVDANFNGVRDDLERWIVIDKVDDTDLRNASLQVVAVIEQAIVSRGNQDDALSVVPLLDRAVSCLFLRAADDLSYQINRLENRYTNTEDRLRAYIEFHETLGPDSTALADEPETDAEVCDVY